MKLYLHVGTHKTGSTHVQTYLRAHAAELAKQGLVYPDTADLFGGPSQMGHHALVAAASQGSSKLDGHRAKLREAKDATRPDETMLLSAEPAYRRTFPNVCPPEAIWDGRRRYLRRLAKMLSDFDVTVVVCFRNRATFGESHYGSVVKTGYDKRFEDYLVDHGFMFDYDRQLGLFRDAFEDVLAYPYEDAARDGVSETFLRKIGFEPPEPDDRKPTRQSPDLRMMIWMARRNGMAAVEGDPPRSKRIRFSTSPAARAALPDGEKTTFWTPANRPFLDRFDPDAFAAVEGRAAAMLTRNDYQRLDGAYDEWLAAAGSR